MKLLDLYILKKYLKTFAFAVGMLVAVICVIDFVEKNDDFIKHSLSFGFVMRHYFLPVIPFYANLLSPITIFIATVFVTARLASHTEIVAMLSSGMSFRRLLLPYCMGALVVGLSVFGLIGWVIPIANKTRVAFEIKYVKNPYTYTGHDVHFKVAPDAFVYLGSYNNTANIGYNFVLETIRGTKLVRKVQADAISWNEKKQMWHLEQQTVRTFDGERETLTRRPARDTTLNLFPKDFASTYRIEETLTTPELNRLIQTKIERGSDDTALFLVEKYSRQAYPFAILILTVMGVIVSARKARGGVGLQIALGFALAFVYLVFVIISRGFATANTLPAWLAAWLPTLVFTGVAGVLYRFVPR
jgi:lipopolysaccharide export system permease protein